jgi:WD40 repeat protein
VQVWDTFTGAHVLTYRGHTGPVTSLVCSLDGQHIISASDDGTVQAWDAMTGKILLTYQSTSQGVSTVA